MMPDEPSFHQCFQVRVIPVPFITFLINLILILLWEILAQKVKHCGVVKNFTFLKQVSQPSNPNSAPYSITMSKLTYLANFHLCLHFSKGVVFMYDYLAKK